MMLPTATLVCLAALVPFSQRSGAQSAIDAPVVETELGARIDRYLATLAVYGMSGSILVERDGRVIVHASYGLADRSEDVPLTVDMPMLIGSLSKQFVAAAILKLEAQGRLRVGDSLPRFFADVPADKRSVTLHQLMTHTAGLEYLPTGNLFEPMDRAEVMRSTLALPRNEESIGRHAYANTGYTLLAGVIESVAGVSFEEFLRRELFEPAGMRSTGFEWDTAAEWRARLGVHSYSGLSDEGSARAFPVAPRLAGAGGVVSTVADLYRWELALRGDVVLPDSSRRKLFTPYVDVGGPIRHAYGWNVITTPRATTMIAHAGDIGGYNADFRRYVDEGLTIIYLSNARVASGGWRQAVLNNVSLLIAGAKYAAPPSVVELPAKRLEAFTGRYRLESGQELRIWLDDGRLMIGGDGSEAIALLAAMSAVDSTLAATYDERTLTIARDMVTGELSSLEAALTPSLPRAELREEIARQLRSHTDSLGAMREPELLGTAVLSLSSARTYWRMKFERGSVMQEWSWQGGVIMSLDGGMTTAMATVLAPTSSTEAATFDPFTGRSVAVALGVDGGRSLTVISGDRQATAVRVSDP